MSNVEHIEPLWHVTVLSNFARAYDKYSRYYSKAAIPESTFLDRFFLLRANEIDIGIRKAGALLNKLGLPGNRLIALRTQIPADQLRPNTRNGLGQFIESPRIRVDGVAFIRFDDQDVDLLPASVEEVSALSLKVLCPQLQSYEALKPRTLSILPIARGCQAACPFCFSEASASAEQKQTKLDLTHLQRFAAAARERGAERFVITGGGEPGLLPNRLLQEIIAIGRQSLKKTVLITNGHHLTNNDFSELSATLADYTEVGLSVLALSRHHYDDDVSEQLMKLRTDVSSIARAWSNTRTSGSSLQLRFICVLQQGFVDNMRAMESYVDWASALGVPEICFKELYVSTSVESVYHQFAANEWSRANQVSLSLVLDFAALHQFEEIDRLPWGAPIFRGQWKGQTITIAAYTEPSLLWERAHGIARSWNLMSDGSCLASLEDCASEISLPGAK